MGRTLEITYPPITDNGNVVYHAHRFRVGVANNAEIPQVLDDAWRDFNTIDGHEFTAKMGVRSAMMGDVFTVLGEYGETDRHFIVNAVGFVEVTSEAVHRYLNEVSVLTRLTTFDLSILFREEELVRKYPS